MVSSFHQLLLALAVLDIIYVTTNIVDYSVVKVFQVHPTIYSYLFPYLWYPLHNILLSWTAYLTMGLATERYLAVCRPIFYRSLELTYSCKARVASYLLPSMFASILLNIPKFLEARLQVVEWTDSDNITVEAVWFNVTSLRIDPDYVLYYVHWTRLLCTGAIPFLYLFYINLRIYSRMRQNSQSSVRNRPSSAKKAGNLATILILIVLVFLISNTPRLVLNLTEVIIYNGWLTTSGCNVMPEWYSILISINHLFLTINSSINFLIYCSVGERFQRVVVHWAKKTCLSQSVVPVDGSGTGTASSLRTQTIPLAQLNGVEKEKGRKTVEDPECKNKEKRKGDEEAGDGTANLEQNDNLLEREKEESRGDEKGLGT